MVTQATDDDSNTPKLALSLTHSPPTLGTALQNSETLITELATLRADLAEKNLKIENSKKNVKDYPKKGMKKSIGINKSIELAKENWKIFNQYFIPKSR